MMFQKMMFLFAFGLVSSVFGSDADASGDAPAAAPAAATENFMGKDVPVKKVTDGKKYTMDNAWFNFFEQIQASLKRQREKLKDHQSTEHNNLPFNNQTFKSLCAKVLYDEYPHNPEVPKFVRDESATAPHKKTKTMAADLCQAFAKFAKLTECTDQNCAIRQTWFHGDSSTEDVLFLIKKKADKANYQQLRLNINLSKKTFTMTKQEAPISAVCNFSDKGTYVFKESKAYEYYRDECFKAPAAD